MQEKNPSQLVKESNQDLFKSNPTESCLPNQIPSSNSQTQSIFSNPHGIFLTHQHKIQATYNFQSLFRKKSQIYNLNKNKKKTNNKNLENEKLQQDEPGKEQKNVKKGHWTLKQNRKYHWFLQLYNKHFILKHLRRTDKIFKSMSAFIGSREAEQCRSHHQKMQKKYLSFLQIIMTLRMDFYGTCNTEPVQSQLQKNGYLKDTKDLLVEQNILKSIKNIMDEQQLLSKQDNRKKIDKDEDCMSMHENNNENESSGEKEENKKQGHFFFGQKYEDQLNYKLF